MDKYILSANGEPEVCNDIITWGRWFEANDAQRVVAKDELPDGVRPTIEDHDAAIEVRQRLAIALRPLTPLERDVLLARAEGETHRQIGRRYGKSYGWAYFIERDAYARLGAKQTVSAAGALRSAQR